MSQNIYKPCLKHIGQKLGYYDLTSASGVLVAVCHTVLPVHRYNFI